MLSGVLALMALMLPSAIAQQTSPIDPVGVTIQGTVRSFDGKPVSDAVVRLEKKDSQGVVEAKTNAAGSFAFLSLSSGTYQVRADKSGLHSLTTSVIAASENRMEKVDLVLQGTEPAPDSGASSAPAVQAMEFADQPNFTVAGVTDWTAVFLVTVPDSHLANQRKSR